MKFPTQYRPTESLDFRSQAFKDAAQALVQSTGCTLLLCRQELFIAEGDAENCYLALLAHKSAAVCRQVVH